MICSTRCSSRMICFSTCKTKKRGQNQQFHPVFVNQFRFSRRKNRFKQCIHGIASAGMKCKADFLGLQELIRGCSALLISAKELEIHFLLAPTIDLLGINNEVTLVPWWLSKKHAVLASKQATFAYLCHCVFSLFQKKQGLKKKWYHLFRSITWTMLLFASSK